MSRSLLLSLAVAASGLGAGAASAQPAPLSVRVRPEPPVYQDVYSRAAAFGPVVVDAGPGFGPGVPLRAIPIAAVTNGAAFGPTGYGYYEDAVSEGPLNRRLPPRHYYLGAFPR
ncbi:hypothetical protein [Methylobacterium oryzihabitans]|uniref:Uncharacterized protein n=1 Tax=Methylobacterium oryzihabitans TaxID=2499852 RepID=A0A3S2YN96_9HYPH|nr:hypothetical protein [Methylobacterium oryzihabitans]RVU15040.1 hypothetical protein EOE48_20760 [Methylobacterium oryzihabitans]